MIEIPYPGLRPFTQEESHLFFGRDEQIDQLLDKLSESRFISVTGLSGCGKSSLVRAGLLANLEYGYLTKAGKKWYVLAMRPGQSPLQNLVQILIETGLYNGATNVPADQMPMMVKRVVQQLTIGGHLELTSMLDATLRAFGQRNILLLVDQFEELFRYEQPGSLAERRFFVETLLTCKEQTNVPIYVVITIRSDWLGQCGQFLGLPEAINAGLYLVPRLTQEQLRLAIVAPSHVVDGDLEDRLVLRLLHDIEQNSDQLPVLQHCLMQMWVRKAQQGNDSAPISLTMQDYEAVGMLQNALSYHADDAFRQLNRRQQQVAETLFRRLSEYGPNQLDMRRPTSLGEVARVAQASVAEVRAVVDVFRDPSRNFLTPAPPAPLEAETVIDVTHESLIRQWKQLSDWARDEAESARIYRRLEETACLWKQGSSRLWDTPDLESARALQLEDQSRAEWAKRYGDKRDDAFVKQYGDKFKVVLEFLKQSEQAQKIRLAEEEKGRRREFFLKIISAGIAVALVVAVTCILLAWWAVQERAKADIARQDAERQKIAAEIAREKALQISEEAKQQLMYAQRKQWQAVESEQEAERQSILARSALFAAHAQMALFQNFPQRSLLLAIEAMRFNEQHDIRTLFAEDALRQALAKSGGRGVSGYPRQFAFSMISADSQWRVTIGEDQTLFLWDMRREHPFRLTPLPENLAGRKCAAISPKSDWLATGDREGVVRLRNLRDVDPINQPVDVVRHADEIRMLTFSPDNRWLITSSKDNVVQIVEVASPTTAMTLKQQGVVADLAVSPDSQWLMIRDENKTYWLWDLTDIASQRSPLELRLPGTVTSNELFSPDSHWFVLGDDAGALWFWNLQRRNPAADPLRIQEHQQPIYRLAATSDSRWLISSSGDRTIRIWDLQALTPTVTPKFVLKHEQGNRNQLRISPDDRWLISDSQDGALRLWDFDAMMLLRGSLAVEKFVPRSFIIREHDDSIFTFSVSRDGTLLVTGSQRGTVRLWDLRAPDPSVAMFPAFGGHERAVYYVEISPDKRFLVTDSEDTTSRLWDLTVNTPNGAVIEFSERAVEPIVVSPGKQWLLTASENNRAFLWDLTLPNPSLVPRVLEEHQSTLTDAVFSPDDRWLATSSADNIVRVWNLQADAPEKNPYLFDYHEAPITTMAFSADARWLVTSSQDGILWLWDLHSSPSLKNATLFLLSAHTMPIRNLLFTPDQRWLVTNSLDKTVRFWDLHADDPGAASHMLQTGENDLQTIMVSPDGRWFIANTGDGATGVWNLQQADSVPSVYLSQPVGDATKALAISADSHWLATGSQQGKIRLWDLHDVPPNAPRVTLDADPQGISSLSISPDSRWLVSLGTQEAGIAPKLWALNTTHLNTPPIVLRGHEGPVRALAFSPDHAWLVTGSRDTMVRLWNLRAENPAESSILLSGHKTEITTVLFSPDSRWLITGSSDGTIRLWRMQMNDLLERACQTAGRNLSPDEWNKYFPKEPFHQTCPEIE